MVDFIGVIIFSFTRFKKMFGIDLNKMAMRSEVDCYSCDWHVPDLHNKCLPQDMRIFSHPDLLLNECGQYCGQYCRYIFPLVLLYTLIK